MSAASRSLGSDTSVIVALPGSAQTAIAPGSGGQIRPTLRVPAGTVVSVFVARDLEFPGGERRP